MKNTNFCGVMTQAGICWPQFKSTAGEASIGGWQVGSCHVHVAAAKIGDFGKAVLFAETHQLPVSYSLARFSFSVLKAFE
jgi:hypothetical protein